MIGTRQRPWWQFRISTILLLMVVIALAVGRWLDHRRLTQRIHELKTLPFYEAPVYNPPFYNPPPVFVP